MSDFQGKYTGAGVEAILDVIKTDGDGSSLLNNKGEYLELSDSLSQGGSVPASGNAVKSIAEKLTNPYKVARYTPQSGKFNLSDWQSSITSFSQFVEIFDCLTDNFGNAIANPFTGMTLPTDAQNVIDTFNSFNQQYQLKISDSLMVPFTSQGYFNEETGDEDTTTIILGYTFPYTMEQIAQLSEGVSGGYSNLRVAMKRQIGISGTTLQFVACDENHNFAALSNKLITDLITKLISLSGDSQKKRFDYSYVTHDEDYFYIYFSEYGIDETLLPIASSSPSGSPNYLEYELEDTRLKVIVHHSSDFTGVYNDVVEIRASSGNKYYFHISVII